MQRKKSGLLVDRKLYNRVITQYNQLIKTNNALAKQQQRLIEEHNALVKKVNGYISSLNKYLKRTQIYRLIGIGGGIGLDPASFKILKSGRSPALKRFKTTVEKIAVSWTPVKGAGKWSRSPARQGGSLFSTLIPNYNWVAQDVFKVNSDLYKYLRGGNDQKYWLMQGKNSSDVWRDFAKFDKVHARERSYEPATKSLTVNKSGLTTESYVARFVGEDKIVFRKQNAPKNLKYKAGPAWWRSK